MSYTLEHRTVPFNAFDFCFLATFWSANFTQSLSKPTQSWLIVAKCWSISEHFYKYHRLLLVRVLTTTRVYIISFYKRTELDHFRYLRSQCNQLLSCRPLLIRFPTSCTVDKIFYIMCWGLKSMRSWDINHVIICWLMSTSLKLNQYLCVENKVLIPCWILLDSGYINNLGRKIQLNIVFSDYWSYPLGINEYISGLSIVYSIFCTKNTSNE